MEKRERKEFKDCDIHSPPCWALKCREMNPVKLQFPGTQTNWLQFSLAMGGTGGSLEGGRREATRVFLPWFSVPQVSPTVSASPLLSQHPVPASLWIFPGPIDAPLSWVLIILSFNVIFFGPYSPRGGSSFLLNF